MASKVRKEAYLRNAVIMLASACLGMSALGLALIWQLGNTAGLSGGPSAMPSEPPPTLIWPTATPVADSVNLGGEAAAATPTVAGTQSPTPYPILVNEYNQNIPITWGDYPGPSIWPATEIPPPLGLLPVPEGQINILLLGNDYRPKLGARMDTIMLLTLNPSTGTASVTSFPRDLYVYAPGMTMMKLNTVQPRGGFELMALTFEYNFGVRPQYYVNITMDAFVNVINTLGGIDVDVPRALSDPTLASGRISVPAGRVHMDGLTARWYVRSRGTSDDFDRNERQQVVLKAIFLKLLSIDGLTRAPELFRIYSRKVDTNLRVEDVIPLVPLGAQLSDTTRISRHTIGPGDVEGWRTPRDRAYVLLPNRLAVLLIMLEAIAP